MVSNDYVALCKAKTFFLGLPELYEKVKTGVVPTFHNHHFEEDLESRYSGLLVEDVLSLPMLPALQNDGSTWSPVLLDING